MKLKIKKVHPDAVVPSYGTDGAACFDLHVIEALSAVPHPNDQRAYIFRTGLAFEIPPGWVMEIHSRSGQGFTNAVRLSNCTGLIDSDYRGEVMVALRSDGTASPEVRSGDRIAQAMLVPTPRVEFEVVDELGETARGAGGFGSTGTGAWEASGAGAAWRDSPVSRAARWSAADLAYNNHYHKVRADMSREKWRELWETGQTPSQLAQAPKPREMSDREWAARDPSLREGSTVRVPGVGEL